MQSAIVQFGGSLVAIGLLIVLVWRLGLGRPRPIRDEAQARALAAEAMWGFNAAQVGLDRAGRGALLADADGRILLVACHGAHFVVRQLGPASRARAERGVLHLSSGEPGHAPAKLALGEDAQTWEERIAALNCAEDA